jgi:hypothetical protein
MHESGAAVLAFGDSIAHRLHQGTEQDTMHEASTKRGKGPGYDLTRKISGKTTIQI